MPQFFYNSNQFVLSPELQIHSAMSSPETPLPTTPHTLEFDFDQKLNVGSFGDPSGVYQSPKIGCSTGSGTDIALFGAGPVSNKLALFPRIRSSVPRLTDEGPATTAPSQLESFEPTDTTLSFRRSIPTFSTIGESSSMKRQELEGGEEENLLDGEDEEEFDPNEPSTSTRYQGSAPKRTKYLPLDAPTQNRNYITPSATSKKTVPAYALNQYRRWIASNPDVELPMQPDGTVDSSLLPSRIQEGIEHRRRQNALSARRTRVKRSERVKELEAKMEALKKEKKLYERRCENLEWQLKNLRRGV